MCKWLTGLFETVDNIISCAGVRCLPLIGADINDGFGILDQGGGVLQDSSDQHIGPCQRNRERYAGQKMHEFLRKHHLSAYNTFWEAGDTFFTSRVPHPGLTICLDQHHSFPPSAFAACFMGWEGSSSTAEGGGLLITSRWRLRLSMCSLVHSRFCVQRPGMLMP